MLDTICSTCYCHIVPIGAPKDLIECRRFFDQPRAPQQRQYEALRAYFVESRPSAEVARAFGYSPRIPFTSSAITSAASLSPTSSSRPRGPRTQPKKSAARDLIVELRKQQLLGLRDQRRR